MEIGKPTTVDVKESANEGQIGGNHYKKPCRYNPGTTYLLNNIGYWRGRHKVHLKVEGIRAG
jgi:hypothetical protein